MFINYTVQSNLGLLMHYSRHSNLSIAFFVHNYLTWRYPESEGYQIIVNFS